MNTIHYPSTPLFSNEKRKGKRNHARTACKLSALVFNRRLIDAVPIGSYFDVILPLTTAVAPVQVTCRDQRLALRQWFSNFSDSRPQTGQRL